MDIIVHLIQFVLGVVLFFIINRIGQHSYSIGYMSISVFAKAEEAPAFNFLIRVLSPLVYLIIAASILYSLGLDKYVNNFYLVNIYYILFRLVFNLITGRGILLNWYRQVLYWSSIVITSFFAYELLIKTKKNLLPDFNTISNELWIIILIFLFHLANNVRAPNGGTIKRKNNYVLKMIATLEKKYGTVIEQLENDQLKSLIYAILIIENFNRPKVARWIEYLRFFITRSPHTLGIMQYYTTKYITDLRSIELGISKILSKYEDSIIAYGKDDKERYFGDWQIKDDLAGAYNTGTEYKSDINEMWNKVLELKYPNTTDRLIKRN
jgi:hypothetical protein